MKYKITRSRKDPCVCSDKHCDHVISKVEWAYTSSKKPLCASHGKLENDYANDGMNRPHI